ncbi:MAG: L-threonylcarbamoyladenylate synthase [Magnetococcus sp. DMHC-8]
MHHDPALPPGDPLQQACLALRAGQVIAHPTETVFGLAADPFQPAALQRLAQLKGRAAGQGFILLIPDRQWLARLILPPSPLAQRLMDRFWPGPLTLLLPARSDLSPEVTGNSDFVAVRLSPAPLVQRLLQTWQAPLASSSANLTGQPPLPSATAVRQLWGKAVAVTLEGTIPPDAQPSTLLQVAANQVRLLRAGALSLAHIQAVVSEMATNLI